MSIKLLKDYPYLYETHLHTNQGSACGRNSGAEMAAACKEYGYTGIFVTDHNWGGNTCISRELPWREWMTLYSRAYYDAREYGDRNGLDVFFGMETGFDGTEFLILGLTPEWFMENEAIRSADIAKQYELVRNAGGIVVQAHPYRVEPYIPAVRVFPEYADAVEAINAMHSNPMSRSHNDPSWNDMAVELARANNKIMTAGSDIHNKALLGGGMAFRRKILSPADFCQALRSGEDYVMTDGERWYDSAGEIIEG